MFGGWLTIGTDLDTKKFDKQIKGLEDKIKKEEEKSEVQIKVKASQEQELRKEQQNIANIREEYKKLLQMKSLLSICT